MGEKSDPRGGIRSPVRHGIEGAGSAGLMTLVLKYFVDQGSIDVHSAFLALGFLTAAGGFALKCWSALDGTARVKVWLNRVAPLSLILLLVSGCGVNLGRVTPHEFTSISGETLIACEVVGIQFAFGDADICRNVEGGHVSATFADMALGIVKIAGNAVAGFFSGLGGAGDGMRAALADTPDSTAVEAPAAPVAEPAATFVNPFVDPE